MLEVIYGSYTHINPRTTSQLVFKKTDEKFNLLHFGVGNISQLVNSHPFSVY